MKVSSTFIGQNLVKTHHSALAFFYFEGKEGNATHGFDGWGSRATPRRRYTSAPCGGAEGNEVRPPAELRMVFEAVLVNQLHNGRP